MTLDINLLCGGALLAGAASAGLYARRKRWADAALAGVAGVALAAVLAAPVAPPAESRVVSLATERSATAVPDDSLAAALAAVPAASAIELQGHGLREAQWRDLPSRPLTWKPPAGALMRLDFPRTVSLGRNFTLTVQREQPQPGWRLQLLAENGQVLADANAAGAAEALSVQWQPPLAENLVLQARVLDSAGKALAQGPVPLRVQEAVPLQVQGRFGAPSFDARVLNQLLTDGGALLDWQTTLGKSLTRSEQSRAAQTQQSVLVADAAWMEKGGIRGALAQAAQGVPVLVLGGNAEDAALWERELGLKLSQQSATTELEDTRHPALPGTSLALAPAPWNPSAGNWQVLAKDKDGKPWLWQRDWQKGRVIWLGVRDWHRYAITEPAALGHWWQQVMDLAALGSPQKVRWLDADPMPLAGLRTETCAQGPASGAAVAIDGVPPAAWQSRTDRADAVCAAFWPARAGWTTIRSGDAATRIYVYAASDWPAWQQALRHDATQAYAARAVPSAPAAAPASAPAPSHTWPRWPRWPPGVLFAAALLTLWWRERR
ncbi:hypothetical protein ACHMW6_32470 [Pseudoduganella sp. UC29_106]|uniref:hypothetical protein n=1 Tax=Pseudoduganella sp. UC29_106 TaxID=3374553 RepID=UPI0037573BDE